MSYSAAAPARRSKFSILFTSAFRVVFGTVLCAAGGMGAGLFAGILSTVIYGMIRGGAIDMTNAYKHFAIPVAIVGGLFGLVGSLILEARSYRTRTSL